MEQYDGTKRKSAMKKHRGKISEPKLEEAPPHKTDDIRKILRKQMSIKRAKRRTELPSAFINNLSKRSKSAGYFDDKLKIQKKKLISQLSRIQRQQNSLLKKR